MTNETAQSPGDSTTASSNETSREVSFYFDFISPNAYLAWAQLERLEREHHVHIRYVPILFAGILNALGQRGPAEIPQKRGWMMKNVVRKANLHGIPLQAPPHHPFNPLPLLRVCSVPMEGDQLALLVAKIFQAVWAEAKDPGAEETLRQVFDAVPGLDPADVLEQVQSPAIKERLRAETAGALEAGVFGVPSMTVAGDVFFGFDDLPFLEAYLRGADTVDEQTAAAWRSITPSAERRQVKKDR